MLPSAAAAQDVSIDEALDEVEIARELSDRAVDATRARRPRARLRARAQGLPRPLRATPSPAAPARPEPRARPRVRLRRPPQRHPRRRPGDRGRGRGAHGAERPRRRRARARREGRRGAAARLRLLVHDPLPRGPRGGAAHRDPARLAGGGAGGQLPAAARLGRRPRRSAPPWSPSCSRRRPRDRAGEPRVLEAVTALLAVGVLFMVTLLARLAPRAAALDGVHARRASRRRSPRAAGSPSRASASRPSTARASRRCSSTRRWPCSPRA